MRYLSAAVDTYTRGSGWGEVHSMLMELLIERLWPGNRWRNYHYLLACPRTGEALAIDPKDGRVKQALDRDAIKMEALANPILVYSRKAKQAPSSAPYKTEAAASGALHHGFLETKVRKNLA